MVVAYRFMAASQYSRNTMITTARRLHDGEKQVVIRHSTARASKSPHALKAGKFSHVSKLMAAEFRWKPPLQIPRSVSARQRVIDERAAFHILALMLQHGHYAYSHMNLRYSPAARAAYRDRYFQHCHQIEFRYIYIFDIHSIDARAYSNARY